MADSPIETHCSNPGHSDKWTCPGCYTDLPSARDGDILVCAGCHNTIECSLEYEPSCHSRIIEPTES